jgi:uncharacterized iron-regulated membrane protein
MYRRFRTLHRWIGLCSSIILLSLAATGFLLALKKRLDWIQPPTQKGADLSSLVEVAPVSAIWEAARGVGLPELQSPQDVDRFELHASKGVFKITSKSNYREIQVDAKSARVLSTGVRNDQFVEQIHDLSIYGFGLKDWLLPIIAAGLFFLGSSGIYMFFEPIRRRAAYRRSIARPT